MEALLVVGFCSAAGTALYAVLRLFQSLLTGNQPLAYKMIGLTVVAAVAINFTGIGLFEALMKGGI